MYETIEIWASEWGRTLHLPLVKFAISVSRINSRKNEYTYKDRNWL